MRKICNGILLALLAMVLIAVPVFALNPPSPDPTVSDIHVNRNLITEGDALWYGEYYIPYAVPPETPASYAFIFRLMDDTDEVAAILPFCYFDNGYNHGVFSFYIEDGDWAETIPNYTFRISQNPAYFSPAGSWDFVIPGNAYSTNTTREDNQAELADNIYAIARDVESVYPTVPLLENSANGTVLSSPDGMLFFSGCIFALQSMAPSLYLVQVMLPDTTSRVFTTEEFDSYAERFAGTWVDTDIETTATQWGLSKAGIMALIVGIPIILGITIFCQIAFHQMWAGMVLGNVTLVWLALMGWLPVPILAITLQVYNIIIGLILFQRSAHFSLSVYTLVWFLCTVSCCIMEGSWLGGDENGIINGLSFFTNVDIGNIFSIAGSTTAFFNSLFKLLLWDYSFYEGDYVYFRYLWVALLDPPLVMEIIKAFTAISAQFTSLFSGIVKSF